MGYKQDTNALLYLFRYLSLIFYLFNWRLITLQYCGGICHTTTWISYQCTCVPPSWTSLPIYLLSFYYYILAMPCGLWDSQPWIRLQPLLWKHELVCQRSPYTCFLFQDPFLYQMLLYYVFLDVCCFPCDNLSFITYTAHTKAFRITIQCFTSQLTMIKFGLH